MFNLIRAHWQRALLLLVISIGMQACTDTPATRHVPGWFVIKDELQSSYQPCTFNLQRNIYTQDNNGYGGCGFTWLGTMWADQQTSAVIINFVERGGECVHDGITKTGITLKTTAFSGAPYEFDFDTIMARAPGEIVVPGIQLVSKQTTTSAANLKRNIGCIVITPSD